MVLAKGKMTAMSMADSLLAPSARLMASETAFLKVDVSSVQLASQRAFEKELLTVPASWARVLSLRALRKGKYLVVLWCVASGSAKARATGRESAQLSVCAMAFHWVCWCSVRHWDSMYLERGMAQTM
jgi:hypothetical protein